MPNTPHFHLASVGSTLTQAWHMVGQGEQSPFWLTADEQTEGRGRLDRQWVSEPGNLYSTYVGPVPKAEALPLLPFAVSLAVYKAVTEHLPASTRQELSLKWPNDVLIDGAKTSGILIEQRKLASAQPLIAIGIGINVEHAPANLGRATTFLASEGSAATPGDLFASLRITLAQQLAQLETSPASIIPTWTQRARGIGAPITVDLGTEKVEGTFDHLASDGALMLRLPSGALRALRTGDIVIRSKGHDPNR
ncbi:MAG: biotin--[acetyl-CoA-carboxylase] ligase [Devosiaceae bacterium]